MEWRKSKGSDGVVYTYEQAHHEHHYDENHHVDPAFQDDDKGWLGGLWSRSGAYSGGRSVSQVEHAHDIAYSAQKPEQNSVHNPQKRPQDPISYWQTSAQDSTRYRQTSAGHSARYRRDIGARFNKL